MNRIIHPTLHTPIHLLVFRLLTAVLLMVLPSVAFALPSEHLFHSLGVRQGLTSSSVNTMLIDSRGLLWIGTSMGINRYDGYEVRTFRFLDKERKHLAANVNELNEDAAGNIWIDYDGAMARYDIHSQQFYTDNAEYYKSLGVTLPSDYKLTVDDRGNLWIVSNGLIQYYDYATKQLKQWKVNLKLGSATWSLADCAEGLYLSNERKVWKFLIRTGNLLPLSLPKEIQNPTNHLRLYVDTENTLWIYSTVSEDIYHYKGSQLTLPRCGGSNAIRAIYDDGHGLLWVATDHNGVFVYNRQSGSVQHLRHQRGNSTSISSDNVTCITSDHQGTIWLGHFKTGVSFSNSRYSLFQSRGLQYGDISIMLYDHNKDLWLGTDGGGVFIEHPDGSYVKAAMPAITISSLLEDCDGTMWVGTYNQGLYMMQGNAVSQVYSRENGALPYNAVWQMAEDNHQNIWIASGFGQLTRFSKKTRKASVVKMQGQPVTAMSLVFDGHHTMYVGTYYGVWAYDTNTGKSQHLMGNRKGTQSFLYGSVVSMCYDRKRDALWVAHMMGISVLDIKRDSLTYFSENNGLFDNYVKTIVEDRDGNMWLATSHGISCVQLTGDGDYVVHNFTSNEGLQNSYFNTFAATCSPNGDILMGGNEGYTMITPRVVFANKARPVLTLTDVMVGDRQVLPDDGVVRLEYDDHQIVFRFFTGNLASANRILYAYRVKGLSDDWVYTDKNSVEFFSLAHGTYTLEIKATDENGKWGDITSVKIRVSPPFYLSWWMMFVYLFAIVGVIGFISREVHNRHRRRIEQERLRMEQGQQVQMSEMKLRFFTNISHDLRTPLTLIISPLQSMITEIKAKMGEGANGNPSLNADDGGVLGDADDRGVNDSMNNGCRRNLLDRLEMIYKNAQLLYNQVNMLLDFRRLDVGAETLKMQSIDVAQYIANICLSFHDYAEERNIHLDYSPCAQHLFVRVDAEKLNKIMYNLLSNAFKFTPDGGSIKVSLAEPFLITVADTGCGISDDNKEHIFERFYQVRNDDPKAGSGIGLHIVNEYVRMHGGTITVTDNTPQGSVFTVNLYNEAENNAIDGNGAMSGVATDNADCATATVTAEGVEPDGNGASDDKKGRKDAACQTTTILIVDDNHDLCTFISDSLRTAYSSATSGVEGSNYIILTASDGVEALQILSERDVTLVVTDVMMPKVDGMELCHRIKTNIKWSHIPVIMLTAKSTDQSAIEGLKLGADDYITKPFNIEFLLLRIDKFLEWQKTSHENFRRKIEIEPSEITITSLDEEFVKRAISLVEEHLSDSDFSVEALGKELCMSRANLYKKMMSITGISPHDFMRSIRLKRARQLLEKSQKQISEIAYAVGYSSPKRFSENFKAEYGMTPSEFVKQKKGEG